MAGSVKRPFITGILLGVIAIVFWLLWQTQQELILQIVEQNLISVKGQIGKLLPKMLLVLIIFVTLKVLHSVAVYFVRKLHITADNANPDVSGVSRVLSFVMWFAFVLISLSIVFGNLGALLTSLGLIGFGVTFALQKPILNFVGWLSIMSRGIYRVGDRIKIGNTRGDVSDIGFMNTEMHGLLETSDLRNGIMVTVPNELVLTGEVENYTKDSNYLMEELLIGITFESDYKKAQKILYDIAARVTLDNQDAIRIFSRRRDAAALVALGKKLVIDNAPHPTISGTESAQQPINIAEELKKLQEEFHPRIRLDLKPSSIDLICQFVTPYDKVKKNKTRIFSEFMDKIASEPGISLAYPHMQIVIDKDQGFSK